jgi:hypothetical protein
LYRLPPRERLLSPSRSYQESSRVDSKKSAVDTLDEYLKRYDMDNVCGFLISVEKGIRIERGWGEMERGWQTRRTFESTD